MQISLKVSPYFSDKAAEWAPPAVLSPEESEVAAASLLLSKLCVCGQVRPKSRNIHTAGCPLLLQAAEKAAVDEKAALNEEAKKQLAKKALFKKKRGRKVSPMCFVFTQIGTAK